MLNPSPIMPVSGTNDATIAGNMLCLAQALPIYKNIVNLAQNGNYWGYPILKGINALTFNKPECIDEDRYFSSMCI